VKVHVDPERCQGHTLCSMIAPAIFTLDDIDGHSTAIDGEVPAGLEDKAAEAIRSCPEQAISVIP
jgi:ferredoxin